MNKQELINRLKKLLTTPSELEGYDFDDGYYFAIESAITLAEYLDESVIPPKPKKPVVPQFVADWYEEHKDNFEHSVQCLCVHGCEPVRQIDTWFDNDDNKPIVTLVKMKLFGYEVKKEKLYMAKNRHTGEYLCYCFEFYHDKNSSSENQRFTAEEKHWKELGYWDNDLYIFEEAEGEDE